MGFIGRFGNSCGTPFIKDEFCKKHRQYYKFCPYLKDRPSEPWTEFTSEDKNSKTKSKFRLTKKGGRSLNKTKKNK
jgi:hypothetical protein